MIACDYMFEKGSLIDVCMHVGKKWLRIPAAAVQSIPGGARASLR